MLLERGQLNTRLLAATGGNNGNANRKWTAEEAYSENARLCFLLSVLTVASSRVPLAARNLEFRCLLPWLSAKQAERVSHEHVREEFDMGPVNMVRGGGCLNYNLYP